MAYSIKVTYENAPDMTFPVVEGNTAFLWQDGRIKVTVTKEEILAAFASVNYILYPFSSNMVTNSNTEWGSKSTEHGSVDSFYTGFSPSEVTTINFGANNFGANVKYVWRAIRSGGTYANDLQIGVNSIGWSQPFLNSVFVHFNYEGKWHIMACRLDGAAYTGVPLQQTQYTGQNCIISGFQPGRVEDNIVKEWAKVTLNPERCALKIVDAPYLDLGTSDMFDAGIKAADAFFGNTIPGPGPGPSDNPYAPGGTSGTGGGKGRFDTSSDPVDFPGLPTLSASRCGLITMFNPTVSELQQLSTKMWSKDFFDNVTKLISNPIDIIVALTIVPVSPPVSGREEVIAGLLSTGVSMNVVSSQYMSFSCGTYTVENFYDAALDYAPYTKVSIYLPYIGVRQLNVDEIMGATLEIKYNIDLFTGACVAMIKVNNAVLYSFDGNIATQIPVNAANYASLYSSLIQGVASIATTAVTGGATAPSLAAQAASFAVNAVTSSKPTIQRAGGITGSNGLMAIQTPFLIFEIPRQSLPDSQQVYTGYPSNITYKLADLSGFTQVSDIHLDGIPATSEELTEIERLLKDGVII